MDCRENFPSRADQQAPGEQTTMLTYSRHGVMKFAVSRTGLTIAGIFDSFYDADSSSRGRRFFDGAWYPDGFEVWAGRRRLVLECPPFARFFERFGTPTPTAV